MRLIVENRFALFGLVALALFALFGVAFAIRPVNPELWMCLGTYGGERGLRILRGP